MIPNSSAYVQAKGNLIQGLHNLVRDETLPKDTNAAVQAKANNLLRFSGLNQEFSVRSVTTDTIENKLEFNVSDYVGDTFIVAVPRNG